MNTFFDDNVFLENKTAKELYSYAKDLPIFDYHCHLSPKEIYEDKVFYNLTELWLNGDHYKWRIMRAAGIAEEYITGDAGAKDKFLKFANVLPSFIGNPVYHWAHLELKKFFGLTIPICDKNAEKIWAETEKQMSDGSFSARKLICRSNVECVITTDDPAYDLKYHKLLKKEGLPFSVLPCFRADRLLQIEKADFAEYVGEFGSAAETTIDGINTLYSALETRLQSFMADSCLIADISLKDFPRAEGDEHVACLALKKRLAGEAITAEEEEEYRFCFLRKFACLLKKNDMTMQLHTGVIRNCNTRLFKNCGVDAGGDSVGNAVDVEAARHLLDSISEMDGLPKGIIIYTLNPTAYYPLATLLGDFQQKGVRTQLGAAWWFADHRDGIKEQLRITAATGGLGLFNGMLTDSRSFTSYARHDYFRRIFCSLLGEWIESGEYPSDESALKTLIYDVCCGNAEKYIGGKL